ncbi:copper-sensing transcriptional repressor CsoR [Corynebacterium pilosum]|uniref:Copper-sensing transcriptional repressor CsoR n=2 Tax=Corynebacterium pilosum TaxID=35756 RepID=A0A376CM61_9CORY|nr:copper-sensing transcriptional repressor CsoR [Corynebacterium pilosum]
MVDSAVTSGTTSRVRDMRIEPEESKAAITRLKRARGQLDGVIRMLEEGVECEKVATQISAVSTAVSRAGFLVISEGMKKCMTEEGPDSLDEKRLEKLFLSLA